MRHLLPRLTHFAALLEALDIGQIDVIGLSAGATSALQLALRHPEKMKHLAVVLGLKERAEALRSASVDETRADRRPAA